ncbi:bleomycin resistance protein [Lysobacter silvisoli]|uniref:Bleomycin resistance protein n=1 Tax=Lysobacter silvisoli TaxID=2293254 RepID=A0A371JZU2_9GAMM|nr:VOC family protein [Lysobacter silvisoli]RDZ27191.1 VOC family protein [Lysobacter silvisoli]
MSLHALTPMLRTPDLDGTAAFYTGTLGFAQRAGSVDEGWIALQRDGVELMLSGFNAHENDTAPAFTGSLYLRTDDVDGWWRTLKDAARVCYPIEDFAYGMREFAVYDNNGYLLQFGQPIASFDAP